MTIDGLKFYGVPFFMEGFEDGYVHSIPVDTDVLVTHHPPHGILQAAMEDITHFGSSVMLRPGRRQLCQDGVLYHVD